MKQVPQNFIKTFCVDDVTLTAPANDVIQEINIKNEKIKNYRVSPPNNHHCCQINIIVRERPGIWVIIHFFLFLRRYSKIFKLRNLVYSYASILKSLYQFDKMLTEHSPANIYMFEVRIVTLK